MSYLDSTVLNDFQASEAINEKFNANYGMIDLATDSGKNADYIPPSVADKLATISASRNATIPVMKDQSVVVTTTPGFENIPINLPESGTYYFTAYDVFSGFRAYPGSFENNQIDGKWWVDQTLRNVLKAMAVSKDDIIETILEARKTQKLSFTDQISQGEGSFDFKEATDILEISKDAQKDTMFTLLKELMRANQLGGDYRIVTSPAGLIASEVEAAKYKEGQSKQLLWSQSAIPMDRRYISNQLSPSTDNFTGFLVRDGGIGVKSNFPFDFRAGTEIAGKKWSIADVAMPYINSRPNIYINKEATEATSLITGTNDSNLIMTHFEEIAIWDRFYIFYRYNSDLATRQNDIIKIKGLTTNPGE